MEENKREKIDTDSGSGKKEDNATKPVSATPSTEQSPANIADDIDEILNEVRKEVKAVKRESGTEQGLSNTVGTALNTPGAQEDGMVDISSVSFSKITTDVPKDQKTPSQAVSQKSTANMSQELPKMRIKQVTKSEKKPSRHMGRFTVLGIFLVAVLLTGAFIGIWKMDPQVTPAAASVNIPGGIVPPVTQEVVFLKGIKVAGVDLGGKTLEEAQALLSLKGAELLPESKIVINSYDENTYVYENEDFEYTYDVPSTLQSAYEFNQKVLEEGSADPAAYAPTDDKNIIADAANGTVDFSLSYKVTEASVQKVVKRVAKKIDIPCVEPHASKYYPSKKGEARFKFVEGSAGLAIDQDKLRLDILAAFEQGDTSAPITVTTFESQPELKMEDVKKATKLISKFTTVSTNTLNATQNMKLAFDTINGTIVEPGETFSFNKLTGDSNKTENGYLPAAVIENGGMATGIGGGICQAATTMYNAAIRANMEIVMRAPHLFASGYVYGGLDATINYIENGAWDDPSSLDLRWKNNTKYQVFVKTYVKDYTLYCELYGWDDPAFDEIRTESWCTWQGSESYGYAAQRVFYKNGKEVKREDLPISSYEYNGYGVRAADPGTS